MSFEAAGRGVECPEGCGKRAYRNRREAKRAARRYHPGDHLSAYPCGQLWHYGHLQNVVRHGQMRRQRRST